MSAEEQQVSGMMSIMEHWMNQTTQIWQSMFRLLPEDIAWEPFSPKKTVERAESFQWQPDRFPMDAAVKNWQALLGSMAQPETQTSMVSALVSAPRIVTEMTDTSWKLFTDMQQLFMNQLKKVSGYMKIRDFSNFDMEAMEHLSEYYEKEFRRFITMPGIGLKKFQNEKINRMTDRFNAFQLAISEFFNLLYQPLQESAKRIQEKTTEWMDRGKMPEDPKAIYRQWIRILEELFMKLFKSENFLRSLQRTMSASIEFNTARREVFEEILNYFSLPTGRELDDVYLELYSLKKEVVKQAERQAEEPSRAERPLESKQGSRVKAESGAEIELKKDGSPFKSIESAQNTLARRRQEDRYEVVKVRGGYGLKKKSSKDTSAAAHG